MATGDPGLVGEKRSLRKAYRTAMDVPLRGHDKGSVFVGPWRLVDERWRRTTFSWAGQWLDGTFYGGSWLGSMFGPIVLSLHRPPASGNRPNPTVGYGAAANVLTEEGSTDG